MGLLAWWCGWADFGETLTPAELLPRFDLGTLKRERAVLTPAVKGLLGL